MCLIVPSAVPNDRIPQATFLMHQTAPSGTKNFKLRDLRFSRLYCCPFKSLGMTRCVAEYLVPDVSKHSSIHAFKETHHSFETSDTTYPATQYNVPQFVRYHKNMTLEMFLNASENVNVEGVKALKACTKNESSRLSVNDPVNKRL
jgi:hypothetical protein